MSSTPLVEHRRGLDPVAGDVELDACPPRRVLEPVAPERARVGKDAVEIEGECAHRAGC